MRVEGVAKEKIALTKVFDLDGNRVSKAKDCDTYWGKLIFISENKL